MFILSKNCCYGFIGWQKHLGLFRRRHAPGETQWFEYRLVFVMFRKIYVSVTVMKRCKNTIQHNNNTKYSVEVITRLRSWSIVSKRVTYLADNFLTPKWPIILNRNYLAMWQAYYFDDFTHFQSPISQHHIVNFLNCFDSRNKQSNSRRQTT